MNRLTLMNRLVVVLPFTGSVVPAIVFCVMMAVATPQAQTSPDNSRVPPLASVRDAAGAVWNVESGGGKDRVLFRNGVQACGGRGAQIVIWQGIAYAEGDNAETTWYRWVGTCWEYVGLVAPFPGPVVVVEPPPVVIPPILVTTGSTRLGWTQPGQTVAQAIAGVTTLYLDRAAGTRLAGVVCTLLGTATDCTAPLPALTPGVHTLALTYRPTAGAAESPKSTVVTVTTYTVLTPTGLGLRP